MIRVYCDSCGEECTEKSWEVSFPEYIVHPEAIQDAIRLGPGFHHTAPKNVKFDLCLACADKMHRAAFASFKPTPEPTRDSLHPEGL